MNELATSDLGAARGFYAQLFGWPTDALDGAPAGAPSVFALEDGRINAAFFAVPDGLPQHWRPCFTVPSAEEALERVRELGGQQLSEPLEIGDGSLAIARDPQGALFSLFAGETDS